MLENLPQPEKAENEPQQGETQETELQIGNAQVHIRAEVPPGVRLNILIEASADTEKDPSRPAVSFSQVTSRPAGQKSSKVFSSLRSGKLAAITQKGTNLLKKLRWEDVLLIVSLLLYLFSRLIALENFPIYFFTDEAAQTVLAQDLVLNGFRSGEDEFLPTYFYNGYQYNLSTSVYVQVLPYLLFGKSIWATRGISALLSVLAALCAALTLKNVFNVSNAWSAALFLSITPAWFLHSRTAFETSLGTTFFAVFIYFYLMYRVKSPRFLYWAVIAGALTYYSYSPIRLVLGLTALFMLISDWPYHWQNRRTIFRGLVLTALLALPLLRFQINHPSSNLDHLHVLNSYWIQPISFWEKLRLYFTEYLHGLNPLYWYVPNTVDLDRHLMKGYGNLAWISAPFLAVGLWTSIRNFKQSPYRILLAALFFAPSGSALVGLGITRSLSLVVPAAILSGLGLSYTLEYFKKRWPKTRIVLAAFLFSLLAIFNVYMTVDALWNGPLWFQNYSLGGMQYGAKQIFSEIKTYKKEHPGTPVTLSPSWANGTDTIARFFFDDPPPFQMGSLEGYFYEKKPLDENMLFIMIPEEYNKVLENPKFSGFRVEKIINYPNGEPGFYFVHLRYSDQIDQILAAEQAARRILQEANLQVDGYDALVRYSYLDMGDIPNIFDRNDNTLVRTFESNPMEIQINLEEDVEISGLRVRVGGTPTRVDLHISGPDGGLNLQETVQESPTPRDVIFEFDEPTRINWLSLAIKSVYDEEPAHVHVWEVELLQE